MVKEKPLALLASHSNWQKSFASIRTYDSLRVVIGPGDARFDCCLTVRYVLDYDEVGKPLGVLPVWAYLNLEGFEEHYGRVWDADGLEEWMEAKLGMNALDAALYCLTLRDAVQDLEDCVVTPYFARMADGTLTRSRARFYLKEFNRWYARWGFIRVKP